MWVVVNLSATSRHAAVETNMTQHNIVSSFPPSCWCVCLFVSTITQKLQDWFPRNLVVGCGMGQNTHTILVWIRIMGWIRDFFHFLLLIEFRGPVGPQQGICFIKCHFTIYIYHNKNIVIFFLHLYYLPYYLCFFNPNVTTGQIYIKNIAAIELQTISWTEN